MKKILFGITSLTLGGAERVLVDLANKLCDEFEITIFTIYSKGELEKQLNPKVKLKTLYPFSYEEMTKLNQKIIVPLKILLFQKFIYNKKIKENYDIEIAFLEGPITRLFSTKNEKTKKIAWIHNDISQVFGKGIKANLKRKIDEYIYQKYEKLIFVSKDNLRKFEQRYTKLQEKEKIVIYNYIEPKIIIEKAKQMPDKQLEENKINFVTVARLVPQKAIDRVIRVHSQLLQNGLKHNFYIIGDGPERPNLEEIIQKYHVEDSFYLLGKKENPYPYVKEASYFCLLSKFEGYGMVLEEAKILNKPIIITDTASREATENYSNVIIVENSEEGIYKGLYKILKENKVIKTEYMTEYDNTKIIEQIIKILEE